MKNAIGQLSEVLYVPDFDGEKVRQKNIGEFPVRLELLEQRALGTFRSTQQAY
jgi:hypothetical protein